VQLPTHTATRYVQPLREGGSLPAVVETEDGGLWVVKFRGAGQGAKALIAEAITARLAAALDLPVPELAVVHVLPSFGRTERDPEIQDILAASAGVNLGLRYLDGAFNFDPGAAGHLVDAALAARIVWFDALVTNPDRTARNPNLLIWRRTPWLIDHGAALYAQHDWRSVDEARTRTPFERIRDHVLLAHAGDIRTADAALAGRLTADVLRAVLDAVPAALLADPAVTRDFASPDAAREHYAAYLARRLLAPRPFVDEAVAARARARAAAPIPLRARR
jgi:hypothetical protein